MADVVQSGTAQMSWGRIARRTRVPLGFVFAIFYLWRAQPSWLSLLIGTVLAVLGIGLRAVASGHVKKNEVLTTTGPYAYVRNPLYLGSIIMALGFVIASRDWWVAAGVVALFALVYVPVIRTEEAFLRSRFDGFERYARTVPRIIPRGIRVINMTEGFSRELYLRHREYNAILGAAAMLAALVVKMLWFRG
jgi:protein-S-isoprenylcysteine O-methyltransferase Ste14